MMKCNKCDGELSKEGKCIDCNLPEAQCNCREKMPEADESRSSQDNMAKENRERPAQKN